MNDTRSPLPFPLLRFWALRILPAWFFIGLMIFLFQINVCAMVHDDERIKVVLKLLDMLPAIIKTSLGGDMLQAGNTSALIAIGYQHPLIMLLYMLFAVGVPATLLPGEIQKGTMELILSRRVTKTHAYICAGLLTVAGMFALVLVMFLGTVLGTSIYDFAPALRLYPFFKTAVIGGLLASAVGGIALLAAAAFQRNIAIWLTVAYLLLNYFLAVFTEWWTRIKWLAPVTIFHYVDGQRIFNESAWPLDDVSVLLGMLIVSTVAGGVIWSRRDLQL
ncbi:MAG TPA: hypothetical protein VJJ98_12625 [Sedimentisphaerales bacterium]|nr:hypothetical protein [Sedimentisphaerales bacterium]